MPKSRPPIKNTIKDLFEAEMRAARIAVTAATAFYNTPLSDPTRNEHELAQLAIDTINKELKGDGLKIDVDRRGVNGRQWVLSLAEKEYDPTDEDFDYDVAPFGIMQFITNLDAREFLVYGPYDGVTDDMAEERSHTLQEAIRDIIFDIALTRRVYFANTLGAVQPSPHA